jgi:predicted ATPase
MRITTLKVDNFKSLVGFRLELAPFSCLIGLNGSGKSTVLQFFDFLAQQITGKMSQWLQRRNWSAADLNSRLSNKSNILFTVRMQTGTGTRVEWEAGFNRKELRCTREKITWNDQVLLKVGEGQYFCAPPGGQRDGQNMTGQPIAFTYEGSILPHLKEDLLTDELLEFKHFFQQARTLELLSPELLRQRTRSAQGSLGMGGERLSAFLHELGSRARQGLTDHLHKVYPHLEQIEVKSLRSGWKQLHITERYADRRLPTEARHINDGLLRLLAIFSQLAGSRSLLLLDELENGMNPELVEYLLDALVACDRQVVVTTHSPLILNFLDDRIARKGVVYLYKTAKGHTQAIRFFDIPSMAEKLTVMGPGEAYEDTRLTLLRDEIEGLAAAGS